MPTQIQTPTQWQRLLNRFGIKGRHQLLLDEVVVPVVLIEDVSELETGPQDATIAVIAPAIAATLGACVLANLSSGTDLLVDRIIMNAPAGMAVDTRFSTIAPIIPLAGGVIDKTWNNPDQVGVPAGDGFANQNVFGAGTLLNRTQVGANIRYEYDCKLVLPPNNVISVGGLTANQALQVTFQYRVQQAS